jgi:hypothetical protein
MKNYQVCACKIGLKEKIDIPGGADWPMRQAIKKAFYDLTGVDADFCFSGWNAELTDIEWEVARDKSDMIKRAVKLAKEPDK